MYKKFSKGLIAIFTITTLALIILPNTHPNGPKLPPVEKHSVTIVDYS